MECREGTTEECGGVRAHGMSGGPDRARGQSGGLKHEDRVEAGGRTSSRTSRVVLTIENFKFLKT